ncbi:MAG TPA: hypothetical protein VIL36_06475 [Acidimicrobiales bacterium]
MIRFGPWPVRGTWLLLPLLAGPVLAGALDDTARATQVVASLGLWVGWLAGLLATLVPRTVTLTVLRILAPAAVAAVAWAVVDAGTGPDTTDAGWRVAGLAAVLVAAVVAFFPETGRLFVDGSSYGDEQRFPLRVPAPLLAGPVPLAWLAVAGGVAAGPLLLAAEAWVPGALALAAGLPAAWWGARALHVLARRWVVLVPAGMVLHDQLALADPILLRRDEVRALVPAPADTEALDLTKGALGLALEVTLAGPAALTLAPVGRTATAEAVKAERLLFTPTQPGALLAAARARRIG